MLASTCGSGWMSSLRKIDWMLWCGLYFAELGDWSIGELECYRVWRGRGMDGGGFGEPGHGYLVLVGWVMGGRGRGWFW